MAMAMIVVYHFLEHALQPTTGETLHNILVPWVIAGVNLFFMLSGWFSIRVSLRGIMKLALTVFFFECVNLLLVRAAGRWITVTDILNTFVFPISRGPYWFLAVYLLLMAVAPIVNEGLRKMPAKLLRNAIAVFTFFTVWSCAMGHNLSNANGLTFLQGLYMYSMGAYLRHAEWPGRLSAGGWLWVFLLSTGLLSAVYGWSDYLSFIQYNSILVVAPSVALFLALAKFRFRSRVVNSVASAALGCYLLQDGWFGWRFLYRWIKGFATGHTCWEISGMLAGMFVAFWVVSWVLTRIQVLVCKPMLEMAVKFAPRKVKGLFG